MVKKFYEFIEDGKHDESRELTIAEVERLQAELASKGKKTRLQLIESYQQLGLTVGEASRAANLETTVTRLSDADAFARFCDR